MSIHELFKGDTQLVPAALRGYRTFALHDRGLSSTGVDHLWKMQDTAYCYYQVEYRKNLERLKQAAQIYSALAIPGCDCPACRARNPVTPPPAEHPSPEATCSCGFYGWYDPDDHRIVQSNVFGVFEATGRVVLGTHGFRAEKVKLIAIAPAREGRYGFRYDLPDQVQKMVGEGLRLMPTVDDLVGLYPPQPMTELIDHQCGPGCYATVGRSRTSFMYSMSAAPVKITAQMQVNADTVAMVSQMLGVRLRKLVWDEAPAGPPPVPVTQQYAKPIGPLTQRESLLEDKRRRGHPFSFRPGAWRR